MSLDSALRAASKVMSEFLAQTGPDGATAMVGPLADAVQEAIADVVVELDDPGVPPTFAGWAGDIDTTVPDTLPDLFGDDPWA